VGWGLGYRASAGDTVPSLRTAFMPDDRVDQLFNAFVQDDIEVARNRLHLIAGSKFEHNGYTGFEIQPSVRALWTPASRHTIFGAVTRAVRTPSRVETDLTLTVFQSNSGPLFVRVQPNPGFVAEGLVAYEAGYRVEPSPKVFVTASTFYNDHDHVLSTEASPVFAEATPAPAHLVLPLVFGNGLEGHSYGTEITADARPAGFLRLTSSYSYLLIDLQKYPDSRDASQEARAEGLTPTHQFQFGAAVDLPHGFDVNWWMRTVGGWQVSTYTTANARIAWDARRGFTVAFVAKDFLSDPHLEFPGGAPGDVQVERSAFVQVTVRR
jgi:iron complex outermembrane receptor protein